MERGNYTVRQRNFRSIDMKLLVGSRPSGGINIYHAYHGASLFSTHETNVAAGIGIPALDAVARAGIPLSAVMSSLGNLVYWGLTYLALDIEHWLIDDNPDRAAEFRSWIADAPLGIRTRRIQELLGFSERNASRFILLSEDNIFVATDEIADAFEMTDRPCAFVLDARAYANAVKTKCGGSLFIVEKGGPK